METIKEFNKVVSSEAFRNYQGGFFKVLISPDQTGGSMALVDMTLPKGVEPPAHIHTREDETFYLLEGEMTFHIGETVQKAAVGDAIFAPRQVAHHFIIESENVRFLTLITPGQFLDYFLEFSFPAVDELKIVAPQGPPPAEFIDHMTSKLTGTYGILFI